MRRELIGHRRRRVRSNDHVAAGHVELIRERERDRAAGLRAFEVAVEGHDPGNPGLLPAARDRDLVAGRDRAARDMAGIAAETAIRPVHALHQESQRRLVRRRNLDALQPTQHRWPGMPGHARAVAHDIVAVGRDRRNGNDGDSQRRRESMKLVADRRERGLREADQIHLVDHEQHPADAEQRRDAAVAKRLGGDAVAGVDQDQRDLGMGGAGRHVAGVLFVAGRIGHQEGAARRGEIAIGHVDGDALLALGLEPVEQERVIELVPGAAEFSRPLLERFDLIDRDRAGLGQQSPDQGRFAVVDRAAGDEAQNIARGAGVRSFGRSG